MAQTRAQLEAAKDQLARRTLISPVAGIVLRRDGEVGEYLQAGQTVFTVGNADTLRAELEVDEEDIPQVVRGQKVLLTADAFPGRVFEASVSEVTPLGDTLNKSYRVRAAVPAGTSIPAGMTVEANIVLREKPNALLVPATAVSAGSVFVVEKGHAVSRKIELGIHGAEEAEILSGIPADALVIAEPPSDLKDGERVRAVR